MNKKTYVYNMTDIIVELPMEYKSEKFQILA